MQKAVIFDLDGTLLYTLEDLKNSVNVALNKFNYPSRTLDEVRNFVGNGVRLLIERAIPDGKSNPHFEECLKYFKEDYVKNMYNETKPFDGILEMLENLRKKDYKIGVVSNKFDKAVKELCDKYFEGKIDVAIGENEEKGVRKKPDPTGVFEAIKLLNCDKNFTYYVGDSEVDIQTAKNSNLKCISVTWGYKDKEFLLKNNAEIIINNPEEIFEILK